MIDLFKRRRLSFNYTSLYVGLFSTIIIGVACALLMYSGAKQLSGAAIDKYYNSEENRIEREEAYINSLQNFCYENSISCDNTEKIAKWAGENRYAYLLIYKDDEIFFSSDIGSGNEEYFFIGGIVSFPNREELVSAAQENDMYELVLSDGSLYASVAEFTDYLYIDLARLLSAMLAVLTFGMFLILYVSRIIARVKKLDREVALVSLGEMGHVISCTGRDELTTLAENIDDMRNSIIEKLNNEREIKEANNELVTSISHDIRTPLTVLLGYIDMMKNHENCEGELREYVIASENTAMRLKQLSDDMFKYSLAFGDTAKGIKLEEYDADTLLDQLLSEHMLLLGESGFDIRSRRVGRSFDGMMVYTDAPNLMRIVDNTFSNISKYADPKFPIELTMERVGMSVVLESKNKIREDVSGVESNGIGLKTCARLSRLIAEEFYYREEDGYFITRLALKLSEKERSNDKL